MSPVRAQGMEYVMNKKNLKSLGSFHLKKSSDFSYLMGGYRADGVRVFLEIHSERTGNCSHNLHLQQCREAVQSSSQHHLTSQGFKTVHSLTSFQLESNFKVSFVLRGGVRTDDYQRSLPTQIILWSTCVQSFVLTANETKSWPSDYWIIERKKFSYCDLVFFQLFFSIFSYPNPDFVICLQSVWQHKG